MRVKTDVRKQAIMAAAADVFREAGYERASMAMIAARLGGSKTTLYSYFPSKEQLFAEVMVGAMDDQTERVFSIFAEHTQDLRITLLQFGEAYLDLLLQPELLSAIRVAIGEGASSDLGRQLFERGPKAGWSRVASFVSDAVAQKRLRETDPWIAAMQLKGLLEAGVFEPLLYGADSMFPRDAALASAIDTFLRSYET